MDKRYFSGKMMPKLIEVFNEYESKLNGGKDTDLFRFRKKAIEAFSGSGFPSRKHEEWKYASLDFLNKTDFRIADDDVENKLDKNDIKPFLFDELDTEILVFVNGHFSKELSEISENGGGIEIKSISGTNELGAQNAKLFGSLAGSYSRNPFGALNSAFFKDIAYVHIPDGKHIEKPVHVLNIIDATEADMQVYPRHFIIAGKDSGATIIETFSRIGNNKALFNSISEIFVDRGANIEYNKFQNAPAGTYYIGETAVRQEETSEFRANTLTFSGDFVRNNNINLLSGERSRADLNGFYYANGTNMVDNSTLVDHAVPNCESNELYKGIMDDNGTGNFNGKILVRPDAQQTNAYQTNKNILLSDTAVVNTKPQLEIYADDVKCSHGATSGYFDEDSLFYLRTRGIGEDKARALLLNAFAAEIAGKIRNKKLSEIIGGKIAENIII